MVSLGKMLVRWNERAMPRRATRCGGVPAMSRPSKTIRPEVGASCPVSRLKKVVLPAPLGPMTEWSDPSRTSMVTLSTAVKAPNSLVSRSVLTRDIDLSGGGGASRRPPRPEARPCLDHTAPEEEHHDHEGRAQQQRPPSPHRAHRLRQPDEYEGADDGTVQRARAADEGREHHVSGEDESDGLE